MTDPRTEKKEKFIEEEKNGLHFKPIHIIGLIVIIAGVAVGAVFLAGGSGGSEADNIEFTFEPPVINGNTSGNGATSIVNPNGGIDVEPAVTQATVPAFDIANFDIKGMTCGGCASGIRRGLGDAEGVFQCEISYRDKGGVVQYDPSVTNPQRIAEFITGMGFATTVAD